MLRFAHTHIQFYLTQGQVAWYRYVNHGAEQCVEGAGARSNTPKLHKKMTESRKNKPDLGISVMPMEEPASGLAPMPDFGVAGTGGVTPSETCAPPEAEGRVPLDIESEIEYLGVAWMTAVGLTDGEIEHFLKRPPGYVATLRSKTDFRLILKRCIEIKAHSEVERARDPEELFNDQILDSVKALIQLRDDPFGTPTARLKAALAFLDRAPKAPKARKEVEQHKTVIALPVGALRGMQQALIDEGTPQDLEIVELLEGRDYKEVAEGEPAAETGDEVDFERIE